MILSYYFNTIIISIVFIIIILLLAHRPSNGFLFFPSYNSYINATSEDWNASSQAAKGNLSLYIKYLQVNPIGIINCGTNLMLNQLAQYISCSAGLSAGVLEISYPYSYFFYDILLRWRTMRRAAVVSMHRLKSIMVLKLSRIYACHEANFVDLVTKVQPMQTCPKSCRLWWLSFTRPARVLINILTILLSYETGFWCWVLQCVFSL